MEEIEENSYKTAQLHSALKFFVMRTQVMDFYSPLVQYVTLRYVRVKSLWG